MTKEQKYRELCEMAMRVFKEVEMPANAMYIRDKLAAIDAEPDTTAVIEKVEEAESRKMICSGAANCKFHECPHLPFHTELNNCTSAFCNHKDGVQGSKCIPVSQATPTPKIADPWPVIEAMYELLLLREPTDEDYIPLAKAMKQSRKERGV